MDCAAAASITSSAMAWGFLDLASLCATWKDATKPFVGGCVNCDMMDTCLFRSLTFRKKLPAYVYKMRLWWCLMTLKLIWQHVVAGQYLAANNILWFFLSVLQDKCEPTISKTVAILMRFLFRPVIFNRGFSLRLQHKLPVYINFITD